MFKFLKTGFQTIIRSMFSKPVDLESLEKVLYEADLGSAIVADFVKKIKSTPEEYLEELEKLSLNILEEPTSISGRIPSDGHPRVILIVGVNGAGKTTTLAKLANLFKSQGEKVLIAAGDTFRAAAIEQLEMWAGQIGVDLVKTHTGADSSGVLYDALAKGKTKEYSTILVDTAGRLESKTDLMRELEKLKRVAQKFDPMAPHEIFLVVDASLGQTALEQARIFHQFTPLTGLILTKLDGSAKGGIALAIYRELKIPIRFITFGETISSIAPFDPASYTKALFFN